MDKRVTVIIGAGAIFFLIKVIMQRGKLELFNLKKEKTKEKVYHPVHNIEAGHDFANSPRYRHKPMEYDRHPEYYNKSIYDDDYAENLFDRPEYHHEDPDSLFDEHFSNED